GGPQTRGGGGRPQKSVKTLHHFLIHFYQKGGYAARHFLPMRLLEKGWIWKRVVWVSWLQGW
ncbi:hypothetical protein, partial [Pseudomonas syringae]|uniref:hypothetical protein n=1 Tax=Pseudomonas syringae TaxID=317 RepID=UPI001F1B7140